MKVLVTGNAGFIGFHVSRSLLQRGDTVIGIDNVNDYYDTTLKATRLDELGKVAQNAKGQYEFYKEDIADNNQIETIFENHGFDRVIHLAAQAGVRHSLTAPRDYTRANIDGTLNILEACRHHQTPHLTYASTSSIYGANTSTPFAEHQGVNHPLAIYAATKRATELMAHSYSHLYRLPTTGLRFFTVYGPWGRPDMALFLFTRKILAGEPIQIFNNGKHTRDFTYVDDIAEGVIRASDDIARPNPNWDAATPDPATSNAPFRIFNIGNNNPVQLMDYIEAIEDALGKKAIKEYLPLQPGDVPNTYADASRLHDAVGYKPATQVKQGVAAFVQWYREYHGV